MVPTQRTKQFRLSVCGVRITLRLVVCAILALLPLAAPNGGEAASLHGVDSSKSALSTAQRVATNSGRATVEISQAKRTGTSIPVRPPAAPSRLLQQLPLPIR